MTNQAFPAQLLRQSNAPAREFLIHGPLCTALDSLGTHQLPADLNENDHVIFSQVGAYGFTESMPYFLCHELAAEYVIENNQVRCVRSCETADYYLR